MKTTRFVRLHILSGTRSFLLSGNVLRGLKGSCWSLVTDDLSCPRPHQMNMKRYHVLVSSDGIVDQVFLKAHDMMSTTSLSDSSSL